MPATKVNQDVGIREGFLAEKTPGNVINFLVKGAVTGYQPDRQVTPGWVMLVWDGTGWAWSGQVT